MRLKFIFLECYIPSLEKHSVLFSIPPPSQLITLLSNASGLPVLLSTPMPKAGLQIHPQTGFLGVVSHVSFARWTRQILPQQIFSLNVRDCESFALRLQQLLRQSTWGHILLHRAAAMRGQIKRFGRPFFPCLKLLPIPFVLLRSASPREFINSAIVNKPAREVKRSFVVSSW